MPLRCHQKPQLFPTMAWAEALGTLARIVGAATVPLPRAFPAFRQNDGYKIIGRQSHAPCAIPVLPPS